MRMHQGSVLSPFLLQLWHICTFINKIEVEQVNQEKRLVGFAGYITMASNRQCCCTSVQKCTLLLPPFFLNQFVKLFTLLYLQCLFDLLVNALYE